MENFSKAKKICSSGLSDRQTREIDNYSHKSFSKIMLGNLIF